MRKLGCNTLKENEGSSVKDSFLMTQQDSIYWTGGKENRQCLKATHHHESQLIPGGWLGRGQETFSPDLPERKERS